MDNLREGPQRRCANAREDWRLGAENYVIVFREGRPIGCKLIFESAAKVGAASREIDNVRENARISYSIMVLHPSDASLAINKKGRVDCISEPAGDSCKRAIIGLKYVGGKYGAGVGTPHVCPIPHCLNADHPIARKLIIAS